MRSHTESKLFYRGRLTVSSQHRCIQQRVQGRAKLYVSCFATRWSFEFLYASYITCLLVILCQPDPVHSYEHTARKATAGSETWRTFEPTAIRKRISLAWVCLPGAADANSNIPATTRHKTLPTLLIDCSRVRRHIPSATVEGTSCERFMVCTSMRMSATSVHLRAERCLCGFWKQIPHRTYFWLCRRKTNCVAVANFNGLLGANNLQALGT